MRVVVVGAGIVGAACALELVKQGAAVTVVDSQFCGGGTTAAGMGHIVVMDDSPAQAALTKLSVELWRDRSRDFEASEYDPCGTLWVASDDEEMAGAETKVGLYRDLGVEAELVSAQAVRALEPWLRPGLAGGMRVPGDAVLYPTSAARQLLAQAVALGAAVDLNCEVVRLQPGVAHVYDGSAITADLVVNAAGSRAGELSEGIPIQPRKGHLAITDRYPGRVSHQVLELGYLKSAHATEGPSVAFNVQPRKTGQLLIGSSREFVGWDGAINHELLNRMLSRATEFMPALGACSVVRVWTGFRPATPDKLPLIGEMEPGIWLATGHEGLGITTSLGTARLLRELIFGETTSIDARPYAANRFAVAIAGKGPV